MPAPVSMTGFAGASFATPLGQATIEIRSVNSRFLDLTLKIADDLRAFEPQIASASAPGWPAARSSAG